MSKVKKKESELPTPNYIICEWVKPDFSKLEQEKKEAVWNLDWFDFFMMFDVRKEGEAYVVDMYKANSHQFIIERFTAKKSTLKNEFASEIDAWESAWNEYDSERLFNECYASELFFVINYWIGKIS